MSDWLSLLIGVGAAAVVVGFAVVTVYAYYQQGRSRSHGPGG